MKNRLLTAYGSRNKELPPYGVAAAFLVFSVGILLAKRTGTLFYNPYNSYSLQAASWLAGRLDLGRNYTHLELAIFAGKYYVSFPPVPSVILLPFVLLFGTETPDALISITAAATGAYFACRIAGMYGKSARESFFWSLFITLGSNFLFLFSEGWVWFMAQTMAFVFLLGAIYTAKKGRGALSVFLWALAVGTRPFSALYLPVILYLLWEDGQKNAAALCISLWPAAVCALFYMGLNFMRFGDPFEFGHNYLPEFLAEPQFSLSYVPQNIIRLFRLPAITEKGIEFPPFDGFAFYIASPIYITLFGLYIRRGRAWRDFALLPFFILHLLLLLMHRTMGGWQFGNRYTVDLLPFVLIAVLRLSDEKNRILRIILAVFGFLLNTYGLLWLLSA